MLAVSQAASTKSLLPQILCLGRSSRSSIIPLENLVYSCQQRVEVEGLLDPHKVAVRARDGSQFVVSVTRHIQDVDIPPHFCQAFGQFGAAHLGHDYVGDQHAYRPIILLGNLKGLYSVRGH